MNSVRTIFPLWMIALIAGCIGLATSSTALLNAQTWGGLNGPPKARDVRDITISNDGSTIYVCDKSVLFKSTNGGASWAATGTEIPQPLAVACKSSTPSTLIAGILDELRQSTDGGVTFTQKFYGAGTNPLRISISLVNQNQMYMGRKALGTNSSVLRSTDGGSTWSLPTTYPSGTNINDIAAWPTSSNEVWSVGADPSGAAEGTSLSSRGAWCSTDLGVTWTEKGRTQYNLKSVAIKTAGPIVFVGSDVSGNVFSTSNGGASWSTPMAVGTGVTSIRALRIRNGSDVWAATNAGIFMSTNNGSTWTQKLSGSDIDVLAFTIAAGNQSLMYASTANSIRKSTDGGTTWNDVTNQLGRMPLSSIAATSNANSPVWTASSVYDTAANFDGYTTWTTGEIPGFYAEHILRVPSTSGDVVLLSGTKPSNRGALYLFGSTTAIYETPTSAGNVFLGTMVDPADTTRVYLWGKDGSTNLYRVQNYGLGTKTPYTVGGSGYSVNAMGVYGSSGPYFYGLNNNGGVWTCPDGPCSGTQTNLNNMTVNSLAVSPVDPDIVYAAGTGGLKQTFDGGTQWYLRYGLDLKKVVISPGYRTAKTALILTADGQKILATTTNGASWTEVQGNLPKPIRDIVGFAGNPPVLYAATDNGAYRISGVSSAPTLSSPADQATVGAVPTLSWTSVSGATAYHVVVATDASFSNVVLDHVLTTTSVTLTSLATGGPYYWKVAAGTFVGALYSTSRSFTSQAQGTITLSASTFLGADDKLHPRLTWTHSGQGSNPVFYLFRYSCTYGGPDCGVWPYPFFVSTTATTYDDYSVEVAMKGQTPDVTFYYQVRSAGVSNKVTRNAVDGPTKVAVVENGLPRETRIYDGYPNPFNPTTTLRYDLSVPSMVSLKLYSVLGEEVATLLDGQEEAGARSVEFDASNLPSGVYFCRFSAGTYQRVQKLILIR